MKPLQHVAEDLRMLRMLCARAVELDELDDNDAPADGDFLQPPTRKAFRDMLDRLENSRQEELTDKQRAWVRSVFERVFDTPQYAATGVVTGWTTIAPKDSKHDG